MNRLAVDNHCQPYFFGDPSTALRTMQGIELIGHLVFRTFEKKMCKWLKVKRLNAKMKTHEN